MTKRIEWLDTAKGILIILVVLGHCHVNRTVDVIINSFHMVAFFSLSGITLNTNKPFVEFLRKKVKSLLVPYAVFSAVFLLYQYAKTFLFTGANFDIVSGLLSVVIPISGRSSTSVYGLWFFPCLFLAEIVCYFIWKLYDKTTIGAAFLFVGITVLCGVVHFLSGVVSIISILPFAIASFSLGKYLSAKSEMIHQKCATALLINAVLFAITIGVNSQGFTRSVDLSSMTLGYFPLYILSSIFGTVMVYAAAILLSKQRFLQFLGKDSMYYYGLHYEVIGLAEKALPGGYCKPLEPLRYCCL